MKNLSKEIVLSIVFNIATILISLSFVSYLSKNLSIEDFGNYQFILTLIAFLGIFSMGGVNIILNRNILKGKDGIFNAIFYRNYKIVLFFFFFFLLLIIITNFFIIDSRLDLLLIALFFLPILGLEKYEAILYAKQEFIKVRLLSFFNTLCYVLLSIFIYSYTQNYLYIFLIMFFVKLITIVIGLIYSKRLLSFDENTINYSYEKELKDSYKLSFLSFYNVGIGLLDKLILGFLDVHLLAIYAIGILIPLKVKDQVKLVISILVQKWAKEGAQNYIKYIECYILYIVLFNILIAFLLSYLAEFYIPILFDKEYLKSIMVVWIISFTLPFMISEYIYQTYIITFHNTKFYRIVTYSKHILYIGLLFFLLPKYGIEGIAFAFFLRSFYSFMLNYFYFLKLKKEKYEIL